MDMEKAIAEAVHAERERCANLAYQRRSYANQQRLLMFGQNDLFKATAWKARVCEAEEIGEDILSGKDAPSRPPGVIQRRSKWWPLIAIAAGLAGVALGSCI